MEDRLRAVVRRGGVDVVDFADSCAVAVDRDGRTTSAAGVWVFGAFLDDVVDVVVVAAGTPLSCIAVEGVPRGLLLIVLRCGLFESRVSCRDDLVDFLINKKGTGNGVKGSRNTGFGKKKKKTVNKCGIGC